MVQLNFLSSCISLAILMNYCISNTNANYTALEENQETIPTTWDYDYGITQSELDPWNIENFWVHVYVQINDGIRNLRISAALTRDGLFVYPDFARKLAKSGILSLGANQFEYQMRDRTPVGHCLPSYHETLILEGTVLSGGGSPLKEDTWYKSGYKCVTEAYFGVFFPYAASQLGYCIPEDLTWQGFWCTKRISRGAPHETIPILAQKICSFAPMCIINNQLFRLLDAKQIQGCFPDNIYSSTTKCAVNIAPESS